MDILSGKYEALHDRRMETGGKHLLPLYNNLFLPLFYLQHLLATINSLPWFFAVN